MKNSVRSAAGAFALVGSFIFSAQTAYAQVLAANLLVGISNPDDRQKLGQISLDDDQIRIPPLHDQYLLTLRAYASGKNGKDDSTAYLRLFVNGARVASRADTSFNTYNLDASYTMVSSTSDWTSVKFEHGNENGPTETASGLEIVKIERF